MRLNSIKNIDQHLEFWSRELDKYENSDIPSDQMRSYLIGKRVVYLLTLKLKKSRNKIRYLRQFCQ